MFSMLAYFCNMECHKTSTVLHGFARFCTCNGQGVCSEVLLTTWDVKSLVNTRINYQPQLVTAGTFPSTVLQHHHLPWELSHIPSQPALLLSRWLSELPMVGYGRTVLMEATICGVIPHNSLNGTHLGGSSNWSYDGPCKTLRSGEKTRLIQKKNPKKMLVSKKFGQEPPTWRIIPF